MGIGKGKLGRTQQCDFMFSWHTNAGGGKRNWKRNLLFYNRGATAGSYDLTKAIHNELVSDIRQEYDEKLER